MKSFSVRSIFPILEWLPLAKESWKDDLIAGITGTVIVIPQAVAFAMIAGMPPIYGFYTAILTPIIAAVFGSSYHLVSGPTTTSSIVLYSIISQFVHPVSDIEAFVSLAILLSFMAGVIKLFMGIAKMGKLVNFVSNSVIIGFSAGAGILIAFKQLKYIFGIPVPQGSSFYEIVSFISSHISETNWYAFGVGIATLVIAILIKRTKKISRWYMLIAMITSSIIAFLIDRNGDLIMTVGEISAQFPPFKIPDFNYEHIKQLASGALILAMLGLIEAVAISRSIALNTHQKLNSNQEFISQGLSNTISSFFSCYTSSGSFTRSSINYQAGAKTPMAAIISAIGLMIVVLLFARYAAFLPKPAMGGIILLVGYNLIDFSHIKQAIKSSNRETIVLLLTFFGTLFFDLEVALLFGIITSLIFYLEKTSRPNIAIMGINEDKKFINIIRSSKAKQCSNLKIVRIDGSLYFASLEVVSDFFGQLFEERQFSHVLILSNGINLIDLGAAEWLTNEVKKWQNNGGGIYFTGLKKSSKDILEKGGFANNIGLENFFSDKQTAIKEIHRKFDNCCEGDAFVECFN